MGHTAADVSKDDGDFRITDETTPLLTAPETGQPESQQNGHVHPNGHVPQKPRDTSEQDVPPEEEESKPMPYRQILLLCYASLAEPVAYFAIFPFINEMIQRNGGLKQENVGFWSGLIESLFSLVQMVLMIFYGWASDRLGRKPVLVFSLFGISFATALFGMSQEIWQMIATRCLAGTFAGSVVTIRTMLSELTTKETQGRAFSWYMFTRNLGIFLGPLIGGAFANPAEQLPSVFGAIAFFENYPYILATSAAGFMVFTAALANLFFLDETLKRKQDGQSKPERPMSTYELLKSPGVATVLSIFGIMILLALSYTAVWPVFSFTRVDLGGFGFSDQMIALFLAIAGASQALWTLLVFPPLQKKFSTGSVLRWCAFGWPFFMALYPILNALLRGGWKKTFWVAAPVTTVIGSSVAMAFACVQLCINDISPSPTVLGTLNALALTVNSAIRAFAPIASTSIFAVGVKWGFASGQLFWLCLILLSMCFYVACLYLPEAAEGKVEDRSHSQSDQRQGDDEET